MILAGIRIRSSGTAIWQCHIGTNAAGTAAQSNGTGILVTDLAISNLIGAASVGNVVSGNGMGIRLDGAGDGNRVAGNLIGTSASGLAALPNTLHGVQVANTSGSIIGGSSVDGNVVSGNGGAGVALEAGSSNTTIQFNRIGVTWFGAPIGNTTAGVLINASGNLVGGLGAENLIGSTTAGPGVLVASGTGNTIVNRSLGNAGLAIDLAPAGATPNDPLDADTGPNGLQNTPVLTSAIPLAGNVQISGSFDGAPNTPVVVDIFSDTACDASGHGEGEDRVAGVSFTTDAAGFATFSTFTAGLLPLGTAISATATTSDGTSEHSLCVLVAPGPTPTPTSTPTITPTPGPPTPTFTPTPTGTPTPIPPTPTPGAPGIVDLEVSEAPGRYLPLPADVLLWGIRVRNLGSEAAPDVRVRVSLPTSFASTSGEGPGWFCTTSAVLTDVVVECGTVQLLPGQEVVLNFVGDPIDSHDLEASAIVSSTAPDANPGNGATNSRPYADLHLCGSLSYGLSPGAFRITNLGPSNAVGVALSRFYATDFLILPNVPARGFVDVDRIHNFPRAETRSVPGSVTSDVFDPNPGDNTATSTDIRVDCQRLGLPCFLLQYFAEATCNDRNGRLVLCLGPIPPPASLRSGIRRAAEFADDLPVYYRVRDELFTATPAGRRVTQLYYGHGPEVVGLLALNPALKDQGLATIEAWSPSLRALVEGRGDQAIMTPDMTATMQSLLDGLKAAGSPALRGAIEAEEARLQLASLTGKTMTQARAHLESTLSTRTTVPVSASIRGAGGSFFHTDLRILNPAATLAAPVTVRFRCAFGPSCDNTTSLLLLPGQMRAFDDVVGELFGAPGAFGAIEVEGDVVVDSRLYTPERSQPTNGMNVPGLTLDEAHAESVLTTLSHSNDPSRGFRTNIGIYNPNDLPLEVTVLLFDPSGTEIGHVSRTVAARTSHQINDIFREAGASADVDSAYAVVAADGVAELFAYAGVIDNRSQDAILVRGKNSRAAAGNGPVILPVAASVPGVNGSFFRSDVEVFNPSSTETVTVTARYRCAGGSCGNAEQTFTLAPRQLRRFDDIVATLFSAPGTLGAIEFEGAVHVDSRLYTPSRQEPSLGMSVPGVLLRDAAAVESVVPSLSHSAVTTTGYRSNLGVYNPEAFDQTATVTLLRPDGTQLGSFSLTVPAFTLHQVPAFATAGITADVENAYAVVKSAGAPLICYAAVADNRSQDPVFLLGRGRPQVPGALLRGAPWPTRLAAIAQDGADRLSRHAGSLLLTVLGGLLASGFLALRLG
jgi:hypothetical protein